jgi:hypothetical protein
MLGTIKESALMRCQRCCRSALCDVAGASMLLCNIILFVFVANAVKQIEQIEHNRCFALHATAAQIREIRSWWVTPCNSPLILAVQ